MDDALCLNNYWGWYHNQKRGRGFDGFNKVMQAPLRHLFDYHKFFVAGYKRKGILSNQPAQQNGDGSGDKNHYRCKNKNTHLYYYLERHFHPYITNERLRQLHHPHYSQMNEGLNNMFSLYAPKSRRYSTTMNLTTHILLVMDFHSFGYEDVFTKLCIHLGINIS